MNRESYYTALFALLGQLNDAGTIKTLDRKFRALPNVTPVEMPALFMTVGTQTRRFPVAGIPADTLSATIYLYVGNANQRTSAGSQLNDLLDAIDAVLTPDDQPQTLGGLIEHARIEGTVGVYDAPNGTSAAAAATIVMLIP